MASLAKHAESSLPFLLAGALSLFALLLCKINLLLVPFLIVALAVTLVMLLRPTWTYYVFIFSITMNERLRFLPISFSINDIFLGICVVAAIWDYLNQPRRVPMRTKLDGWMLALFLLFVFAGIFSLSPKAYLVTFKYSEAILAFYLTVYFLRSRQVRLKTILKVLLSSVLLQCAIAIFQSFTGVGNAFVSDRGYLGYFGLGSSRVFHGKGTFFHFNNYGNFMACTIAFFLPLLLHKMKAGWKKWGTIGLLFSGLIVSYSRGSLLGFA